MTIVVALCTVIHNAGRAKPLEVFELNTTPTDEASLLKLKAIREPTEEELAKYHEANPEAAAEVAEAAAVVEPKPEPVPAADAAEKAAEATEDTAKV